MSSPGLEIGKIEMAKIKLRVVGSPKIAGFSKGVTVNAENISEIVRHQRQLDNYEYDYSVFLNGVKVNDEWKSLRDGDEVTLIPITSGG